jgi:hypothetical protein
MTCEKCRELIDITDLTSPYVIRRCEVCDREIKLRQVGNKGEGIQVEKGDQFIIPNGWLQFSANPLEGNGEFTRSGLEWFAKTLFVSNITDYKDKTSELLLANEQFCINTLKGYKLLEDIDIENQNNSDELYRRIISEEGSEAWWTYYFGLFNDQALDGLKENDIKKVIWSITCSERFRAMLFYKKHYEDVVWMGYSARRIVDAINKWENNQKNNNEEFWQKLFNQNPYLLSQIFSFPVVFIKDKAYVGGMNIDNKDAKLVDFLFASDTSDDAILVEIKTPCTKILGRKYRKNTYSISSEISGAINQVLDYRRSLVQNFSQITKGTKYNIELFNPKCIIIAGNSNIEFENNEAKKKSFELFRNNQKDVSIVTFNELFKKAETLATIFNLIRTN